MGTHTYMLAQALAQHLFLRTGVGKAAKVSRPQRPNVSQYVEEGQTTNHKPNKLSGARYTLLRRPCTLWPAPCCLATSHNPGGSSCHPASTPISRPSSALGSRPLLYEGSSYSSVSAGASCSQQQSGTADATAAAAADTPEAAVDPAVEAAKDITRAIRAATEPEQLLHLIQQHRADLSHIHVSAVFTAARRMCDKDGTTLQAPGMQQLLQQLPALAEGVKNLCRGRELGDIMGACRALQLPVCSWHCCPPCCGRTCCRGQMQPASARP